MEDDGEVDSMVYVDAQDHHGYHRIVVDVDVEIVQDSRALTHVREKHFRITTWFNGRIGVMWRGVG